MSELTVANLAETIQITGGFGPDHVDPEVMKLRADFVEASGWHPSHTVPKPSMEKYPDSDPYDLDPNTLHLSARRGSALLAYMRITPCTEENSLSGAMMAGREYEHNPVDGTGNWDITRLVTAYEAYQRGVKVEDRNINNSVAAAVMMFGVLGGIQHGGGGFFDGENGMESSWRFTIDEAVKWLLEESGIIVTTIEEAIINGDKTETILGVVDPYESMANIIEKGSTVPVIGLPTKDVLRCGYESYDNQTEPVEGSRAASAA